MHFLDLIMYFVTAGLLAKILGQDLLSAIILPPYTVVYIVLFALWPDWNWADFDYHALWAWFKW
jgi:hypothetical protein